MSKRSIIVGIDPGVNTGFAIWDIEARKFTEVTSMKIHEAMDYIRIMHLAGSLHSVVIEDARMRDWFGKSGRERLQGAGSIKRDSQIIVEFLGSMGIAYRCVSPRAKGAKLTADQFAKVANWGGRTNQHGRDAAMLVLGRKA